MQKTKIVHEIIGEAIKPYGFEYIGDRPEDWLYEKSVGEVGVVIVISKERAGKLRLDFLTNAYGHGSVNGARLVKEGEDRGGVSGYYQYNNEQEFIRIIEYFKYIIFEYGFEVLEKMSVPTTSIRPTNETELYLYENHDELNKRYRKQFNIDESTTHEEIFQIIQEYILDTQDKEFEEVKEVLIGLSAVLGTVYADNASNGKWELNPGADYCKVVSRHGMSERPLLSIIEGWRTGMDNMVLRLNNTYKYITREYGMH